MSNADLSYQFAQLQRKENLLSPIQLFHLLFNLPDDRLIVKDPNIKLLLIYGYMFEQKNILCVYILKSKY